MEKHDADWLGLLFLCALFLVSCGPAPVPTSAPLPISTPTFTPTSLPSPTPVPTWTPTPTLTPTLAPTINAAVVAAVTARGLARLEAAGVEPLCLRWEDVNGDGEAEWVGLYFREGDPPRLMAFVLDGDTWYDLSSLEEEKHGLGEYPTCELETRDVNADGRVEILVWGHAGASTDLLHVFVWDGTTYALLAFFEGEAGVRLENADGDLADEVSVCYDAGPDLVWEAVYTWDGIGYGWTWERYDWRYLDRPHAYLTDTPERAVISFYLAVDDHDIPGAYGLFDAEAQVAQPYEAWAAGFATTVAAEVGTVHEQEERSEGVAAVAAQVRAYDNVGGRIVATLWDVRWVVVQTVGGWRLESASTKQLDQWEARYYP